MLDELEELELVLQHYAVTWGVKLFCTGGASPKAAWSDWGMKPHEQSQEDDLDCEN
jgi:[phosphatase 2A protein]-leucine-carboxy methyltransferase